MNSTQVPATTHHANTVGAFLRRAEELRGVSDTPELDLQLLAASALARPRTWLLAHPEAALSHAQQDGLGAMIARRRLGEPVAYITGVREFWSMPLHVTSAVLIPRPETELLVETALELLDDGEHDVVDLGTGSGAIAIALASERPRWSLLAGDVDPAAIATAKENAARLLSGKPPIRFFVADGGSALAARRFDLIVSNPPYVAESERPGLARDLRFEPERALLAGRDGLAVIRTLVPAAARALRPGGWLLLEHGCNQHAAVAGLMKDHGFGSVTLRKDLADLPRATLARTPP